MKRACRFLRLSIETIFSRRNPASFFAMNLLLAAALLSPAQATADCTAVPSGLVGWWSGDGHASDLSANGNHGTATGGVSYQDGVVGPGMKFDGISGNITGSASGFPLGDSARTISAWINTANMSGDRSIFHYGVSTGGLPPSNIHLYISSGTGLPALTNGYVGGGIFGTKSVADGKWHLITAVFEGNTTNQFRMYIDGAEDNSATVDSSHVPATSAGSFSIGQFLVNGGNFNGLIDEVQIFNRALTADEIKSIHASGSAGLCKSAANPHPQLIGWLPGDLNSIDVIGASSVTLENNATYAPGVVGPAFSLDGVDDYIRVNDSWSYSTFNDFTVSAWAFIDPASNTGERRLISHDNYTMEGAGGRQFYMIKSSSPTYCGDNKPLLEIGWTDADFTVCSPNTLSTGWHHFAGRRSSGIAALFVDGTKVAETNVGSAPLAPNVPLVIGRVNHNVAIESFKGLVDEFKIHSGAVADDQIRSDYLAGSAGTLRCYPASSALKDRWTGDGSFNDIAGTNNGTSIGDVAFAQGKVGQSFSFDGIDDYISFGSAPADFGLTDYSLSFWIKTAVVPQSYMAIINKRGGNSVGNWWEIRLDTAGRLFTEGIGPNSVASLNDGKFHQVTFAREGSTVSLYIDGVLDNSMFNPGDLTNSFDLQAGMRGYPDSTQMFNGQIDELQLYNKGLTAAEAAAAYKADQSGICKPAQISVSKSATTEAAGTFTYTLTITNNGPFAAHNLFKSDTLPAGVTFVSAATTTGFCGNFGGVISCSLGDMASSATATVTVKYSVDALINGKCGSANGQTFIAKPATELCESGTPSAVTGNGPWNWSCKGFNNGTTALCSAAVTTYTVNFTAAAGGTITGTAVQTINHGAAATEITALPNTGYHFVNWTGTGGFITSTANPLTVDNVTSDQTITANFSFDVTITSKPPARPKTFKSSKGVLNFTAAGNRTVNDFKGVITADSWIKVDLASIKFAKGKGSLQYAIMENAEPAERAGSIVISGAEYPMNQLAQPCVISKLTVNPATPLDAAGGEQSISIEVTPSACKWKVVSYKVQPAAWFSAAGSFPATDQLLAGNQTLTGIVGANITGKARSNTIAIATADGKSKKSVTLKQGK